MLAVSPENGTVCLDFSDQRFKIILRKTPNKQFWRGCGGFAGDERAAR